MSKEPAGNKQCPCLVFQITLSPQKMTNASPRKPFPVLALLILSLHMTKLSMFFKKLLDLRDKVHTILFYSD